MLCGKCGSEIKNNQVFCGNCVAGVLNVETALILESKDLMHLIVISIFTIQIS